LPDALGDTTQGCDRHLHAPGDIAEVLSGAQLVHQRALPTAQKLQHQRHLIFVLDHLGRTGMTVHEAECGQLARF
jgi:hypothetical protein